MGWRNRRVIIGSNLKMYKTNQATLSYLASLQDLTKDISRDLLELFILPSYPTIADCCRMVDPGLIRIGAQNVHWEPEGCFTGEISIPMLKDIGTKLVMVGHADRRQKFNETDIMVNQRVLACLNNDFQVVLCVGDSSQDQEFGVFEDRLSLQLKTALHRVQDSQLSNVWVAYEPVWAIGEGGTVASPDFANSIHGHLHKILGWLFPGAGGEIPVLYGGSVNLENAADLVAQPEIDGLFIGRAAWDAGNFNQIIRSALNGVKSGNNDPLV